MESKAKIKQYFIFLFRLKRQTIVYFLYEFSLDLIANSFYVHQWNWVKSFFFGSIRKQIFPWKRFLQQQQKIDRYPWHQPTKKASNSEKNCKIIKLSKSRDKITLQKYSKKNPYLYKYPVRNKMMSSVFFLFFGISFKFCKFNKTSLITC